MKHLQTKSTPLHLKINLFHRFTSTWLTSKYLFNGILSDFDLKLSLDSKREILNKTWNAKSHGKNHCSEQTRDKPH